MIINHNMNAINANRMMGSNITKSGKSMEKLSSGLRINRAGDDAAGLAISEKMRGQIRGLNQASRNSQDGISMIQTAEGALNETHSILQRMRELAVQAGNDTNTGEDRGQIQNEINQLTSEINRIGNTTEFNNQNVLDGGAKAKAAGAAEGAGEAAKAVAGKFTFDLGTGLSDEAIKLDGKTFTYDAGATGAASKYKDAATLKTAIEADTDLKDKYTVEVTGTEITLTQKEGKESDTAATLEVTGTKKGTIEATLKTDVEGKAAPVAESKDSGATAAKEATSATIAGTKLAGTTLAALTDLKINGTKVTLTATKALDATGALDKAVTADNVAKALNADLKTAGLDGDVKAVKNDDGGISLQSIKTGEEATIKLEDSTTGDLAKLGLKAGDAKGEAAVEAKEAEGFKATLQIGANKGQAFEVTIGDMRAEALGLSKKVDATAGAEGTAATEGTAAKEAVAASTGPTQAAKVAGDTLDISMGKENGAAGNDVKFLVKSALGGGTDPTATYDSASNTVTVTLADNGSKAKNIDTEIQKAIQGIGKKTSGGGKELDFSKATVEGAGNFKAGGIGTGDIATGDTTLTTKDGVDAVEAKEGEAGTTATGSFTEKAGVTDGTTSTNGESALDVSDHKNATDAIEIINNAINKVSTQRSKLGAFQNRLEHTINNLGTASENLTAAESRIRDVDMAKEMMAFSKNNILQQASQAMLAQAKQAPQGVLQLLR